MDFIWHHLLSYVISIFMMINHIFNIFDQFSKFATISSCKCIWRLIKWFFVFIRFFQWRCYFVSFLVIFTFEKWLFSRKFALSHYSYIDRLIEVRIIWAYCWQLKKEHWREVVWIISDLLFWKMNNFAISAAKIFLSTVKLQSVI